MSATPKDTKKDTASTFEPIHPFDMAEPRTWAGTIGMLNWDKDKIVFSKRSLLEFLKSCDVTVNTNFTEIQKLPKYATFGHFSQAATDAAVADLVDAEIGDPTTDSAVHPSQSTVPRPTRKVVDPPGGKQTLNVVGGDYEETDALSLAPPRDGSDGVDVDVERMEHLKLHLKPGEEIPEGGASIEEEKSKPAASAAPAEERASNPPPGFRPTRKVREGPGGKSSIGDLLGGGDDEEQEAPRRRQNPAQQSSGSLW